MIAVLAHEARHVAAARDAQRRYHDHPPPPDECQVLDRCGPDMEPDLSPGDGRFP
jgi:hypothetical protein